MHYGHPQQTQIIGRVPIGVGPMTAGFTGELLAPAPTKTAAARAPLARVVRRHDRDADPGDVGLVLDERPQLKEAPARVVPANRLRNIRPATYAGQVFETDPRTHLNRILDDAPADGVVLCRLETSLPPRQPFQDHTTTTSRRPCAFRGFLLKRTPNSMVAVADGLTQVAGPRTTVRGMQDVNATHVAADAVNRRDLWVALNLDLDVEKERGFAASRSFHRELGRADAALTSMSGELLSLIGAEGKRDTPSTSSECQAGGLAIEAEGPFVVLHGPAPIVVDAAARGLCRLAIRSDTGDGPYGEVGREPEALADRPVTRRLQLVLVGHGLRGFACDLPTSLSKRFNRRGHLGTVRVTAIELASDGQHLHGLHALLILNVALDKVTVGPKRRKAGFQSPKFVSPRRPPLNRLDHAMYSELRIDVDQQVDVVRHDLDLNQDAVRFPDNFGNDLLEPLIDTIDQYLAPIPRTKDHAMLAREDDGLIRSVLHAGVYRNVITIKEGALSSLWLKPRASRAHFGEQATAGSRAVIRAALIVGSRPSPKS